jgi:ketosteroid isomerase-like protein
VSADREALLREAFSRIGRRDLDGFLEIVCQDVEWTEQMLPGDMKVYRGHDGVRQWFADVTEVFTWGTLELVALEESGDDAVSEVALTTAGQSSGVEVRQTVFHAIRFREGRIATITAFLDREEARRAAGLVR